MIAHMVGGPIARSRMWLADGREVVTSEFWMTGGHYVRAPGGDPDAPEADYHWQRSRRAVLNFVRALFR